MQTVPIPEINAALIAGPDLPNPLMKKFTPALVTTLENSVSSS
jgi:hypothetical protein